MFGLNCLTETLQRDTDGRRRNRKRDHHNSRRLAQAVCASSTLEGLEARWLLAWPNAPFTGANFEHLIYTNQNGDAIVSYKQLETVADFDGYSIYFREPGYLNVQATGATPTQLAYYEGSGAPDTIDTGANVTGTGQLAVPVPARRPLYLGVQAKDGKSVGGYGLVIRGAAVTTATPIPIGSKMHEGVIAGKTSGGADVGFYKFVASTGGDWTVTVTPSTTTLDVTLNLFDSTGKPIGGSFVKTINAGGAGKTETWKGTGLKAGGVYFVRVDARSGSGGYAVRARWSDLSHVNAFVVDDTASEDAPADPGSFRITRTVASGFYQPLTVQYTMSGHATNGKDYQAVTGVVTIAAGKTSAIVNIRPLSDSSSEGNEDVVLTVRSSSAYDLGTRPSTRLTLLDHREQAGWPTVPLPMADYENTLYTNQFGKAEITSALRAAGDFNGHEVFFDDIGDVVVHTTGTLRTQMAYYDDFGKPVVSDAGGGPGGNSRIEVTPPPDKRPLYFGVRAIDGKQTGNYGLSVQGPAAHIVYTVPVSKTTHKGSFSNKINAYGDYDFLRFQTTKAGNWTVRAVPTQKFDATLNVYNKWGAPLGGSYTQCINRGKDWGAESWTGINLPANTTYFVRVDGHRGSKGDYRLEVEWTPPTTVSVSTSDSISTEGDPDSAAFAVSRTRGGDINAALPVQYTVSGSAVNGTDYQTLSGTVVIPAGRTWTTIPVAPIDDALAEKPESVVLTLQPSDGYSVSANKAAVVWVLNNPGLRAWPSAPFGKGNYESTVYVNQYGDATLTGKQLEARGDFDGYAVSFDDPGYVTFQTTGDQSTQVAFYDRAGAPVATDAGAGTAGNGKLTVSVSPTKDMMLFGVRAADGVDTGAYGLSINGVPAKYIEKLVVSEKTNAASSGSDISGGNDSDFYTFTTTHAGNWIISVVPDKVLNPTLNVYDKAGNPVAGTFIAPVNRKGPGETEIFALVGVPLGAQYFIRVDGADNNVAGGYGVSAMWADTPTVKITAGSTGASEVGPKAATFTVTRTKDTSKDFALPVRYAIAGSARNGVDYKALTGTVVIPAGELSATITITPIVDTLREGEETVTLTLLSGSNSAYDLDSSKSATIKIANKG